MRIYKSFFRFEKCRKACKYRLYRLMRTYKEIVKNYILIFNKFHLTADGSFLTYANGNGDFKNSGDWGTNYIYDSAAKKWYYSPQGTNLGGISNSVDKGGKTEAQIIDKIKNEGWEEVTLTGNTFSK